MSVEEQIKAILIEELYILEDRTLARIERKLLALVQKHEEERKQKLQQWVLERTKFYEDAREDYDEGDRTEVNFLGRIQGINEAMRKFEELLKP